MAETPKSRLRPLEARQNVRRRLLVSEPKTAANPAERVLLRLRGVGQIPNFQEKFVQFAEEEGLLPAEPAPAEVEVELPTEPGVWEREEGEWEILVRHGNTPNPRYDYSGFKGRRPFHGWFRDGSDSLPCGGWRKAGMDCNHPDLAEVRAELDAELECHRILSVKLTAAQAEIAKLREALAGLLISRDAAWEGGHDWQQALDKGIAALAQQQEQAQ